MRTQKAAPPTHRTLKPMCEYLLTCLCNILFDLITIEAEKGSWFSSESHKLFNAKKKVIGNLYYHIRQFYYIPKCSEIHFWRNEAFRICSLGHSEYVLKYVGVYKWLSSLLVINERRKKIGEISFVYKHLMYFSDKNVRWAGHLACVGLKELICCSLNWIEMVQNRMEW
jgi:hypothetical protein